MDRPEASPEMDLECGSGEEIHALLGGSSSAECLEKRRLDFLAHLKQAREKRTMTSAFGPAHTEGGTQTSVWFSAAVVLVVVVIAITALVILAPTQQEIFQSMKREGLEPYFADFGGIKNALQSKAFAAYLRWNKDAIVDGFCAVDWEVEDFRKVSLEQYPEMVDFFENGIDQTRAGPILRDIWAEIEKKLPSLFTTVFLQHTKIKHADDRVPGVVGVIGGSLGFIRRSKRIGEGIICFGLALLMVLIVPGIFLLRAKGREKSYRNVAHC